MADEPVTVQLIPSVRKQLASIRQMKGLSQTDAINQAITLMEFVTQQMSAGKQILVADKNVKIKYKGGVVSKVILTTGKVKPQAVPSAEV